MGKIRKIIEIYGIVQGVGFRPFVYNLASKNNLTGHVNNNSNGVFIDIQGEKDNINEFVIELRENPPELARINEIRIKNKNVNKKYVKFDIKFTENNLNPTTYISPDYSICDKCKEEIFDEKNKRYRYPFTNCTCCGPRFTIIKKLPYDRVSTTMNEFEMCEACKAEYDNPSNRRFHAQPNACPNCGPKVFLKNKNGELLNYSDCLKETAKFLKKGEIIAIKGLGGFNLSCDAKNEKSIKLLRERKHKPSKPLAVMMKDIETVRKYCDLSEEEEKILLSNKRPIILLRKKKNYSLPENLAPNNKMIGVMLPYTPLHYLIFNNDLDVLVMTSANMSGEPIIYKNDEALRKLRNIAEYFLLHNREIYINIDDSVTRYILKNERLIRPGRGYAPNSILMKSEIEILALGSQLKNTISISNGTDIFISEYIGDIENKETINNFQKVIKHYLEIYKVKPKVIVYDKHPGFVYKQLNLEEDLNLHYCIKYIETQHHHSHIVSCMVENKIDEKVIGIAYDGTGYGDDKKIWGGEFFVCNKKIYKRIGHLEYFKLPGGESAIKNPWKIAISLLYKVYKDKYIEYVPKHINSNKINIIKKMIDKNINSPETSSIGRLFDGVSALLGLIQEVSFEGEAAINLENISNEKINDFYKYNISNEENILIIKLNDFIREIIDDIRLKISNDIISAKFHNTIVEITNDMAKKIRKISNINVVALSGGVFQNKILLEKTVKKLEESGFNVYTNKIIPCNDSGISLGQLVIANEMFI